MASTLFALRKFFSFLYSFVHGPVFVSDYRSFVENLATLVVAWNFLKLDIASSKVSFCRLL